MITKLFVPGIKCDGCVSTITEGLLKSKEISNVLINKDYKMVEVTHDDSLTIQNIKDKLLSLGYSTN